MGNGRLRWDWAAVTRPDGLPRAVAVWHRSHRAGTPDEVEYQFHRRDGIYRWHAARTAESPPGEGITSCPTRG